MLLRIIFADVGLVSVRITHKRAHVLFQIHQTAESSIIREDFSYRPITSLRRSISSLKQATFPTYHETTLICLFPIAFSLDLSGTIHAYHRLNVQCGHKPNNFPKNNTFNHLLNTNRTSTNFNQFRQFLQILLLKCLETHHNPK